MSTDLVTLPEERGVETHGIERVSPTARAHVRIFDNFTMWLSANLVISTVGLGALALFFNLGFWDALLAIVLFNALGVLPVAFFSTLGPKLGLRQMTISRFSFGWVGAIVMAVFNIAACIGWSTVNVIAGGQLVAALSNGVIPAWAGILIIAVITTIISIYGYRYVHRYERYAWIPMAIIFLILFFAAAPHMNIASLPGFGTAGLASFITFGGAIFGFATGWSSYAADYNVNQPEETPSSRVFWLTFLGVFIPCVLLETLGLLLISVPDWAKVFGDSGGNVGDMLHSAVSSLGPLGLLILVFLAWSVIANNVPNDYSLGLSIQVFGKPFQRVPRAIWTLVGAVIYVLIALPSAQNFGATLDSFLLLVAYWLGPWSIILVLEHFVFRRTVYNVDDWNTREKLPLGWAALVSMALGLVGVYLGASQQLFVGPLAAVLDKVDIGFELGVVFAAISYLILRRIELNSSKR
ncbi:MAG TPA: cytosine permease [Ktedonobacteraceae bacterium]|jgi:NCS1 nucleoside transporter family|nr:cytosine permease [Ktedonobacteraceae bacterium]